MLDVFITVDVEVWCDGWKDLDQKFPDAFRKYVYGPTPRGDYGLSRHVDILDSHGLTGVFFVEPLFATRFGVDPLREIVAMIRGQRQEVQLHLHTEWVDESRIPLLDKVEGKRQHLRYFTLEEQTILIDKGRALLHEAGAPTINAFRAGSFAFNRDTLRALATLGIPFDSSYNACLLGPDSGVAPGEVLLEPIECEGVYEYPMTIFSDGVGGHRHAQLSACSYRELEGLLWRALENGYRSFVLLSHNFELLNRGKTRPDSVVVRRLEKLCAFLDRNRDCFNVRGFHGLTPNLSTAQPKPLPSAGWKTAERILEQFYRRRYR